MQRQLTAMVVGAMLIALASAASAKGPGGAPAGGGGSQGNTGGAVRGLDRARGVANPQGVDKGISNAQDRIDEKGNPKNPNTQSDTTTPSGAVSPRR